MTQIKTESAATYDIGISGMTCASCVARVEKDLKNARRPQRHRQLGHRIGPHPSGLC